MEKVFQSEQEQARPMPANYDQLLANGELPTKNSSKPIEADDLQECVINNDYMNS